MKPIGFQNFSGFISRPGIDLLHFLSFGFWARLMEAPYFLLVFGIVILASTFEFRSLGFRALFQTRLKMSVLASLGWSLSAMVSDWQSQGAGSRVLGRMLGLMDWSAGVAIVHGIHWVLMLALLWLLEAGIRNLRQAFRELFSTSKSQ